MKKLKLIPFSIIIIIVFCELVTIFAHDEVLIPLGEIKGSFMKSRLGENFHSFRGIRYAEPPIGENRFQVKRCKKKIITSKKKINK